MGFLHQDTPVTRMLGLFMDLIILNALWLVCSLPLVTLGASTTALYDVTLRMAFHEDANVTSAFFRAFRKNWKQGSILFFLALGVGAFLAADFFAATLWDSLFADILKFLILAVAWLYLALATHVLPVRAYFGESPRETVRHAFVLAMRNNVFTVFIMFAHLLPFLLLFFRPVWFWKSIVFWLVTGVSLVALLCSLHLARLFDPERARETEREREQTER